MLTGLKNIKVKKKTPSHTAMFLSHSVTQMLDIGPLKNPLGYHATGVYVHYRKELVPTQQMAALPLGHHERGVKERHRERKTRNRAS